MSEPSMHSHTGSGGAGRDLAEVQAMAPIWSAIEGDIVGLEVQASRVHQIMAAVASVIALSFGAVVSSELGWPLASFALWAFAWFTASNEALKRGIAIDFFVHVNPWVELLVPGLAMLLMTRVFGPEYALASWVPPQMFAVFIGASILRFRIWLPLFMGCVAALEYGFVYFWVLQPQLAADAPVWALSSVQLIRALTLVLMGIACSGAVWAFKGLVKSASMEARARDLFGKYVLGEEIASGGMGTVMRATYCPEGGFQRDVAVKKIHPHLSSDASFLNRFRDEAALCSRLVHPNIVAALDFGRVGQTWFFAMEYVDGTTLSEILKHRTLTGAPIDERTVCWLVRQILDGLDFAHSGAVDASGRTLRVVHRDLSPHNILIGRSGQVKISDFGVARALRGQHDVQTVNLAGKPAYMAPEQLKRSPMDERSDLFTVGVLLWEALTNERLYLRDNEAATLLAVLEESAPPPSNRNASLSPVWDAFCARALARDPDERFQTAGEMLAELSRVQETVGLAGADDVARLVRESDEGNLPELQLD